MKMQGIASDARSISSTTSFFLIFSWLCCCLLKLNECKKKQKPLGLLLPARMECFIEDRFEIMQIEIVAYKRRYCSKLLNHVRRKGREKRK